MASPFKTESFYRAKIQNSILSTTAPPFNVNVTELPALTNGLLTISPNTSFEEIVEYTHSGTPGASGVISVTRRGIDPAVILDYRFWVSGTDYNVSTFQKAHAFNDDIRGDVNHVHINQCAYREGGNAYVGSQTITDGNVSFSGTTVHTGIILKTLTTAQRDAIPSPQEGAKIKNSTTGTFQGYIGGTWVDEATGTTANASTTVSGKVEIATQSELNAGTDTGGTGAQLVPVPSIIAKAIQDGKYNVVTDSGTTNIMVATLTPAIASLVTGQIVFLKVANTSTSASTLNVNGTGAIEAKTNGGVAFGNGTVVANGEYVFKYNGTNWICLNPEPSTVADFSTTRQTLIAGESVDGSSTPVPVYMSNGTGGRTSGRFYKSDANDTANLATSFIGFVNVNASGTGNPYTVITGGVIGGFSGLTIGEKYYVSDTVGTISATPGTYEIFVGYAISTTQIQIQKVKRRHISGRTLLAGSGTTSNEDTTVTCGFKPRKITIYFQLLGANSGATQCSAGIAEFNGTTMTISWGHATGAASGNLTFQSLNTTTDATNPLGAHVVAGGATGNAMKTTLSVNSVSSTGAVIRAAYVLTGTGVTGGGNFYCIFEE